MPDLVLHDVQPEVIERLTRDAEALGRGLEEHVLHLLRREARVPDPGRSERLAQARARIAAARDELGAIAVADSTLLIRSCREGRCPECILREEAEEQARQAADATP
jgi:hypothetical protein